MVDFVFAAGHADRRRFQLQRGRQLDAFRLGGRPGPAADRGRPVDGIERVTIIWADNAIQNEWLQVTVKATADTGLAEPFTFYHGNLIGSVGDSAVAAAVTQTDVAAIENHPTASATLTNPYDINRDGTVNATDQALARSSAASANTLALIMCPTFPPPRCPATPTWTAKWTSKT